MCIMCKNGSLAVVNLIVMSFLTMTLTLQSEQQQSVVEFSGVKTLENLSSSLNGFAVSINMPLTFEENTTATVLPSSTKRLRRDTYTQKSSNISNTESSIQREDTSWSNINEEVDVVIPLVLAHLQTLGIEYLQLPDMKESISVSPLLVANEVGLFLTNGIVYNIAGILRYGNAYMTYANRSFFCQLYLTMANLQFEYNFILKLMALEGYGKVIGSLENTIIYAELMVNVTDTRLMLNDFRIIEFSKINVQLDQTRIIRQLTGAILSPITMLFRDRITTSISDGLKEQMQTLMEDFDNTDPLELRKFAKRLLSGLTGQFDNDTISN